MTHDAQASHFARLALACIQRELPNSIQHVLASSDDVRSPRALRLVQARPRWRLSLQLHKIVGIP